MTAPFRILVIEDEAPIRRLLRITLEGAGYVVDEADRGRAGLERATTGALDLAILDLGLPDMDGKSLIRAIREWSSVPILILSVRSAETEKIAALDAGADDYVTKPFAVGELLARLRALLRSRRSEPTTTSLVVGPLEIDLARRTVSVDGRDVKLARKHYDLLVLLAQSGGRLLSHRQILSTIWGPAHAADTHYVRIAIAQIRDKLGDDAANPRFILTEPGVGYRLLAPAALPSGG